MSRCRLAATLSRIAVIDKPISMSGATCSLATIIFPVSQPANICRTFQGDLSCQTHALNSRGTQWHPEGKDEIRTKKRACNLLTGNGTNRARTCDLSRVKRTLFQLSYGPGLLRL